jgi:hypothetical protein
LQSPRSSRNAAARLALSTAPTSAKILSASMTMLTFGILAFGLGLDVGFGTTHAGSVSSAGLGFLFALILLVLFPFNVLFLTTLFRSGAWLEGTTLAVCDGLRTRRRDLATAPVSLGSFLGQPCLVARDNVTGRKARLGLKRLAAPELAALTGAITAGGRQDPDAWLVVAALRQRAAWHPASIPPGVPFPPR